MGKVTFNVFSVPVMFTLKKEMLQSWNTEMQRQTAFGMSLDQALETKG